AWTRLDGNGVDVGGCINTLTSHHPSPLAKGNPQHTNLVEIKRA
ncbi:dimethyl sulfoxide reductase subunit A, partial [Salmonella enterica subsp. enterica]|nr:dimethyl sulfoxide reductase subunit A [Salmonella enterica subsp. enterica]